MRLECCLWGTRKARPDRLTPAHQSSQALLYTAGGLVRKPPAWALRIIWFPEYARGRIRSPAVNPLWANIDMEGRSLSSWRADASDDGNRLEPRAGWWGSLPAGRAPDEKGVQRGSRYTRASRSRSICCRSSDLMSITGKVLRPKVGARMGYLSRTGWLPSSVSVY